MAEALKNWISMFQENKWCFVAYTGQETLSNSSRWYTLKTGPWSIIRHQLEAFGAEAVESADMSGHQNPINGRPCSNNYLRGLIAFKPGRIIDSIEKIPADLKLLLSLKNRSLSELELNSKDYVMPNNFIYLIRTPMPIGGRSFVPIEEKSSYALLQYEKTRGYEVDEKIKILQQENSEKVHASDLETKGVKINSQGICTTIKYLVPKNDYFCMECESFGRHFKEACYLWPKEIKDVGLAVGPKKFKKSIEVSEEDASYYNLLYKRTKL